MDILIKVLQLILSLSLLVVIHEFGHFLFARIFKIRVEKFYLFFDPWFSIFKFKKGDTEYGMGWVPFGGYVKISGMIDESMDTEQMSQPPQPYEFRSKPAWQRLLVMVGGVMMNVVLAVVIYIGMSYAWGDSHISSKDIKNGYAYSALAQEIGFRDGDKILDVEGEYVENALSIQYEIAVGQADYVTVERDGEPVKIYISEEYIPRLLKDAKFMEVRLPFVVADLVKGESAAKAGFLAGDSLVSFNGESLVFFDQFRDRLADNAGGTATIGVSREVDGQRSVIELPVEISEEGKIGIYPALETRFVPITTTEYTFWQAVPAGIERTGSQISSYWEQLKMIFSPKTEAYKSLGGIMSIGNIFPGQWSWEGFWSVTAFLSIILAVMNMLPIPGLDGGHVVFTLYEMITRRKPSDKFMEKVQIAGMIFIFALLIYANGNDIYRFFIQ